MESVALSTFGKFSRLCVSGNWMCKSVVIDFIAIVVSTKKEMEKSRCERGCSIQELRKLFPYSCAQYVTLDKVWLWYGRCYGNHGCSGDLEGNGIMRNDAMRVKVC